MQEHRIPFTSVRVISVLLLLVLIVFPLYDEGSGTLNFLSGRRLLGTAAALVSGEAEISDWSFVFTALASLFAVMLLFGAFAKIKTVCVLGSAFGFLSLGISSAVYIVLDSGVHDIIGPTSDFSFFLWVVLALFAAALCCSAILQKPGDFMEWFITLAFFLALICAFAPLYVPGGGTLNLIDRSDLHIALDAWREGSGHLAEYRWPVMFRFLTGVPALLLFVLALLRKRAPATVFAGLGLAGWAFSMVDWCMSVGRSGALLPHMIGKTADITAWMLLAVPILFAIILALGINSAGRTGSACGANGGCAFMDSAYSAQMGKPANMTYCGKLNKFVFKRDHCPMFRSAGCANGICANATHDHRGGIINGELFGGRCYCSHYGRVVAPRTHCKHYVYYFETADFHKYVDETASKIR